MESSNKPLASIDLCDPHYCNITFLVEGKLVCFNRFLLEFHSPVFATIFSERWCEGKDPSDPIELELKFDEMQILFKVLTPNGDRSISFGNVKRLLELGDFYQIGLVASLCERFLLGNLSRDRFPWICGLAATFNLRELLNLVNQEYILNQLSNYADSGYEKLLAVSAKAKVILHGVFDRAENKLIALLSDYDALRLLILGYECGAKRLVDTCMPIAARHSTAAKLQEAKAKLSVGLHCELMLRHYACAQRKKKEPSSMPPRSESIG